MTPNRIGRSVRALRLRRGWRQRDVAAAAGTSRSTIGRIEAGQAQGVPLATLEAVATALGARIEIDLRWHGEGLDRLLDAGHAALVECVVRHLRRAGWDTAVEASFAIYGERGSIDVLAHEPRSGLILVVEVKSVIPDVQATIHALDRKARLAPVIARDRGWSCAGVGRLLVIGESRTTRRRLAEHAAVWSSAFPERGWAARRWLSDPTAPRAARPFSGLWILATAHRAGDPAGSGIRRRVRVRRSPDP